jgi:hypothetical protein
MNTLQDQNNINTPGRRDKNKLLCAAALFFSLNQGIAQHKNNPKHISNQHQTEKTHTPSTHHNTLEQSD